MAVYHNLSLLGWTMLPNINNKLMFMMLLLVERVTQTQIFTSAFLVYLWHICLVEAGHMTTLWLKKRILEFI